MRPLRGSGNLKVMRLEDELATWLLAQRWFAGKGRTLRDLAIVADTEVAAGDPALRHLIVLVSHGATADHYQIPIGLRSQLPDWLEHARIGTADDGRQVYDALHDPALTRHLIRAIAANQTIESLTFSREPGAEIETELDSIVLTAEQSNTSLVFGEQSILKVFRRVFPGPNPDLEVTSALSRLGSPHVAEPFGSIETIMDGVTTTLAILSRYLRTATDGWTLAATSVRDLYASNLYASDTYATGPFPVLTGSGLRRLRRPGPRGRCGRRRRRLRRRGPPARCGDGGGALRPGGGVRHGRAVPGRHPRPGGADVPAAGSDHRRRTRTGPVHRHDRQRLLQRGQDQRAGAGPAGARRLPPRPGHADRDGLDHPRLRR